MGARCGTNGPVCPAHPVIATLCGGPGMTLLLGSEGQESRGSRADSRWGPRRGRPIEGHLVYKSPRRSTRRGLGCLSPGRLNRKCCRSSSRGSADKEEPIGIQNLAGEWVRRRREEALVLLQPEEILVREEAHDEDA